MLGEVVCVHEDGGLSHTTDRFSEVFTIVRRNFGIGWMIACFGYFKYMGLRLRIRSLLTPTSR